ncbi:MAG: hypothetical protein AAF553_01365 [Pseudomonadota bacterium]
MSTQLVLQSATQLITEQGTSITVYEAPVVKQGSGTDLIAWISIGVAILALSIAIATYRRGARVERQARFEKAYGSTLRELLRQLDKELTNLTAFIVYNGRELETLCDELDAVRTDIEEHCFEIINLLTEIDHAKIGGEGWREAFRSKMLEAEKHLEEASEDNAGHFKVFSAKCSLARTHYQTALSETRTKLTELEGKI